MVHIALWYYLLLLILNIVIVVFVRLLSIVAFLEQSLVFSLDLSDRFLLVCMGLVEVDEEEIGYEGWTHFLCLQSLPVKVIEPWVLLELLAASVDAYTLLRALLETLIDEVCSLPVPTHWHIRCFQADIMTCM